MKIGTHGMKFELLPSQSKAILEVDALLARL